MKNITESIRKATETAGKYMEMAKIAKEYAESKEKIPQWFVQKGGE